MATLASPLIDGNGLRSMGKATRRILPHRDGILIHQDRLDTIPANRLPSLSKRLDDGVAVWARHRRHKPQRARVRRRLGEWPKWHMDVPRPE